MHQSELILLSYAFSHLLHYFSFSNSFFSLTLVFHLFLHPVLQPLSSSLTPSFRLSPSLPHLYLHSSLITSPVIHSPLSFSHHVFFFSFVWYSNITMYMIILLENIHAYLGISVYLAMHICAYFIYISVFWYFSVHSSIKRNQSGVVFGSFDSFRYLG